MKRPLLLWAALLTGSLPPSLHAQQHDVELSSKWVNNYSLEISARKYTYGSYTVWIHFNRLENTRQAKTYRTVIRGDQRLLTLTPADAGKPVGCSYTYRYIRGYHHPKLDSTFIYRLPVSTSRAEAVRAFDMYNLNQRYFDERPARGWKSIQFEMEPGDTVFACRKGLVVEVTDGHDPLSEGMAVGYHSGNNQLLIEHEDGTLARYSVFEKGSIPVKEGDTVYPGTVLGRAGTFSENGNHQIRFSIYFPALNRNYKEGDPRNSSVFEWVYYNPWFATADGARQLVHGQSYRAVSSEALVQKEMTKKEIKALTGR